MSREAMKQALDALEAGDWYIGQLETIVYSDDDNGVHAERDKVKSAITALRAALDAPPVLWYHPLSGRVRFEETPKWTPLFK